MIAEIMNLSGLKPRVHKLKKTSGEIPKSTPVMIRSKAESQ